jgi:hypothetical protein
LLVESTGWALAASLLDEPLQAVRKLSRPREAAKQRLPGFRMEGAAAMVVPPKKDGNGKGEGDITRCTCRA